MPAPIPTNEVQRLQALHSSGLLDTLPEQAFDDIVQLAAHLCGTPISAVSLVDVNRQWFKARVGLQSCQTDRGIAFCAHAILDPTQPLIVPDAALDPRFADSDFVTGDPHIRFYAGAPLVTRSGFAIGSLCVKDTVPRELSPAQIDCLVRLARQVMQLVESRQILAELAEQKAAMDEHAVVIVADTTGRITYVNDRFCALAKHRRADVLGAAQNVFSSANPAHAFFAGAFPSLAFGSIWRGDVQARTREGADYWIQATVVPVRNAGGGIIQYVAIGTDITDRRRNDDLLRLLRSAVEQAEEPVIVTDAQVEPPGSRIVFANSAYAAQTGYTIAEVLGRSPALTHGALTDRSVLDRQDATLALGETFHGETVHYRKDGTPIDLEWKISPVRNAAGTVTHFVSVQRDITARRRNEQIMQQQRSELRLLFDYIPAIICFKDTENNLLRANRRLADSMGKTIAEIEGRAIADLFPAESARFYADDLEVIRSGVPKLGIVESFRTPRGEELWLETDKVPVHGPEGDITGLVVVARDITAQKKTEANLQLQQARLQALFDLMPALIWFKDTENNFLVSNRQAAEAAGRTVAEMANKPGKELYPQEAEKYYADDLEVIRSGQPKTGIIEPLRDRDGHEIWIRTDKVPFRNASGKVSGIVVMATDVTAQRRATAELAESKRFLHSTLNALTSHIAILDERGVIIEVNAAWHRFAAENGFTGSHGVGDNYLQVCGSPAGEFSAEASIVASGIKAVMAGTTREFCLEYLSHGPTKQHWFQLRATRFDGDGPARTVVAHENITARKQIEEALRRQQAELRLLFDLVPATIMFKDTKNRILRANRRAAALTGNTVEEVEGRRVEELCPEHAARYLAEDQVVISSRTPQLGLIKCIQDQAGNENWIQTDKVPFFDQDGAVAGIVILEQDITELKRTEQRLLLLNSAVEQCNEAIVISDARLESPGPRIQFVNPAFTAMSGFTAAEAVGQTTRIQQGPRTDLVAMRQLVQALAAGKNSQGETISYRKDGSTFYLEWHVAPVRDATGQVTHYIGIQRDVSARKAALAELTSAREAALESSRLKSRFLANMSHELRTPLNTINGLSATLIEQDLPAEARQCATLILQCGETLLQNIQTILTHASLDAGKTTLDEKPFQLADVIMQALRITGRAARIKGIDLDYYLDPGAPASLVGDPFRLQQILVNLLTNSVKFTDRGRVRLRMQAHHRADGWHLGFIVADTGIGISAASLRLLFQPFAQADDSNTRRFDGTGLGLVITKSLIELMGGRISVRSKPGAGSVFRFKVIIPAVTGTPTLYAPQAHALLSSSRFLIDKPGTRRRRQVFAMVHSWQAHATVFADRQAGETYDCAIRRLPPGCAIPSEPSPWPVLWLVPTDCKPPAAIPERSATLLVPFGTDELANALLSLLGKSKAATAAPAQPAPVPKLGERLPLRILSADDISTNREVLKTMCRHFGYTTDLAENGAEVLEKLGEKAYDLILLDVQMPVLDGISAAEEICRRYPDRATRPRMIAITASVQPGDRERCLAAGMDDYLSKPVLPKILAACIERVCDKQNPVPVADAVAALIPGPDAPLVDVSHLRAITEGLDESQTGEFASMLHESVKSDYRSMRRRLAAACEARHSADLITCVHGLKGCAFSAGWARLGQYCAAHLVALRENRFAAWDALPAELDRYFTLSSTEMGRILAAPLPAVVDAAVPAGEM